MTFAQYKSVTIFIIEIVLCDIQIMIIENSKCVEAGQITTGMTGSRIVDNVEKSLSIPFRKQFERLYIHNY